MTIHIGTVAETVSTWCKTRTNTMYSIYILNSFNKQIEMASFLTKAEAIRLGRILKLDGYRVKVYEV